MYFFLSSWISITFGLSFAAVEGMASLRCDTPECFYFIWVEDQVKESIVVTFRNTIFSNIGAITAPNGNIKMYNCISIIQEKL